MSIFDNGGSILDTGAPLKILELDKLERGVSSGDVPPSELDEMSDQLSDEAVEAEDEKEDTGTDGSTDTMDNTDDTGNGGDEEMPEGTPPIVDEDTDNGAVDERTVSTEMLRDRRDLVLASEAITMDDVKNVASSVGHGVYVTASTAFGLGQDLYNYLAPLGIKYLPIFASHIRKGVLFLLVKALKTFYRSVIAASNYVNKLRNNQKRFKSEIAALKAEIQKRRTEENNALDVDKLPPYLNTKVVKWFSMEGHISIDQSLVVLNRFLDTMISALGSQLRRENAILGNVINTSARGFNASILKMMNIPPFLPSVIGKTVRGFEPNSNLVESHVYTHTLPNEMLFVANLPRQNLQDQNEISAAYQASGMFLAPGQDFADPNKGVNYMTLDSLDKLLDRLDVVCDLCIRHQSVYEMIRHDSEKLKFSYRHAYQRLGASEEKVSIQDSVMDLVHLKQSFITRVYVAACIDIHDYVSDYVRNMLKYARSNVDQFK